jgi:hypothetical protein
MASAARTSPAASVNVPIAYSLVCINQRNFSSGVQISVTENSCGISGANTIDDSSLIGPISKLVVKLTGTKQQVPLGWAETVNGSTTTGTTTLTPPATFVLPDAIPAGENGNVNLGIERTVGIDLSGTTLVKLPLITLVASN